MTEANRNVSAEHSVIGAICIDQRVVEKISPILSEDDFTAKVCAEIYAAAVDATERGKEFDCVYAADVAKKSMGEEDGTRFVMGCMDVTPTIANAETHAELIHKYGDGRRLQAAIMEQIDDATEPQELAGSLIGVCQDYIRGQAPKHLRPMSSILSDMYSGTASQMQKGRVDTGYPKLDGILKGLCAGQLGVIGARPGVGKSAIALDIARTTAQNGKRVIIYSYEMLGEELVERLIANTATVPLDNLIENDLTADEHRDINAAAAKLYKLPIIVNDCTYTKVSDIRSQARMYPDLGLIVVDFLTLMRSQKKAENRNLEIGEIVRDLKNLASELEIPIIALAQLKRGKTAEQKPTLEDLRDSGEIEQSASKVIFLWVIDEAAGTIGVSVAKNRRGRKGVVQMHFMGEFMRYVEMSEEYVPPKSRRSGHEAVFGEDE